MLGRDFCKFDLTSRFLSTGQIDLREMHECETDTEHDGPYSTFADLREIAVFQDLEVAEKRAHFQSLLVPLFDIRKVEKDVVYVNVVRLHVFARHFEHSPRMDALRSHAD